MTFKNKFYSKVVAPFCLSKWTPYFHISKLCNRPKKVISLGEKGIGSEKDPLYMTAHRGVSSVAPQNSLPAYVEAVRLGYYSAECDIRLTKDRKWVLIHNDTVDSQFFQKGKVSDFTFDEIRSFKYKYGSNFWAYDGLKIPTLDEYLDVFVDSKTRPQIEIKEESYDLLYQVVDAVKERGLRESAIIISFDLEQLRHIHNLDPEIELWYLIDTITEENIAEAKAIGDNVWLSPCFQRNDKKTIQLAIDANVNVSFWTVNKLEDAKLLYDMGLRYVESDVFCN